jgi:hypothetical protein
MVGWDSTTNGFKSDNTLQSFIFSIDKKFVVKQNDASCAIRCHQHNGPTYGCHDIYISTNSNVN